MVQNEAKIAKTISAFQKYASYQQKLFLQTKNDKGNAATSFFFFSFFFLFNVASDSSKAANTCKEEGIALFLDNTFLASKEEEEEVSDSILPIENN